MAVVIACCRLRGDWCGIATCAFIFVCWTYAFYCSVFTIISQHFVPLPDTKNVLLTGYFAVSFLTIFTMAKCVLSDPGKLLDVSNAGLLGWEYCQKCGKHRPPRSHHCSRCAQCVRKMDHHCPWINNCVGEDNNMRFTQFLLYTALMAWFSLALCLSFFMDWLPTCAPCQEEEVALDIKIEVVCLTFISGAYAFFTSFMFFDRLIMISADVTTLELMRDRSMIKNSFRNPRKPSWFTLFSRTFGSSNIISWFIPCRTVHIRPSYEYDSYSWQDHI